MFFTAATPTRQFRFAHARPGRAWERLMDEALQPARRQASSITQDDTSYTLVFDMPGVARDQLNVDIEGSIVRIETREGAPRRYQAAYELPQDIDTAQSEAKLEHGVLTLKLGKAVPASKATTLSVH